MHQWKQLNTQLIATNMMMVRQEKLFTNYVCGQVKPEARFAESRVAW
jgi:hypothetical protein